MTSQEEEAGLGQRKVSAQFVCSSFNLIMCLLGIHLGGLQRATDCLAERSAHYLFLCRNASGMLATSQGVFFLFFFFFLFILSFFLVVVIERGQKSVCDCFCVWDMTFFWN